MQRTIKGTLKEKNISCSSCVPENVIHVFRRYCYLHVGSPTQVKLYGDFLLNFANLAALGSANSTTRTYYRIKYG